MKNVIFLFILFSFIAGCRYADSLPSSPSVTAEIVSPLVSAPSAGEIVYTGTTMNIRWEYFKPVRIKIELWKKKQYHYQEITPSADNTGSFTWRVPDDTPSSVSYQVKIISVDEPDYYFFSEYFVIRPR